WIWGIADPRKRSSLSGGLQPPPPPVQVDIGPGWGWASFLLPQLEQTPLFDSINFPGQIQYEMNETARLTSLAVLLCPSDSAPLKWTAYHHYTFQTKPSLPLCDIAASNYVGMFGITEPGVDGEGM